MKFGNFLIAFEKAENDLKNWFLWLETAWIIFKCHNFPKISPFLIFKEEVKTMVFLVFPYFDLIFGQNMDSKAPSTNFCHKRIVHKKIQLKIPTLRKNDCSATWKPNTYQIYIRYLQQSQEFSKVLKICSYFSEIYFLSNGNLQGNIVLEQYLNNLNFSIL